MDLSPDKIRWIVIQRVRADRLGRVPRVRPRDHGGPARRRHAAPPGPRHAEPARARRSDRHAAAAARRRHLRAPAAASAASAGASRCSGARRASTASGAMATAQILVAIAGPVDEHRARACSSRASTRSSSWQGVDRSLYGQVEPDPRATRSARTSSCSSSTSSRRRRSTAVTSREGLMPYKHRRAVRAATRGSVRSSCWRSC